MQKIIKYLLAVCCFFSSCQKADYISQFQEFSIIEFLPLNTGLSVYSFKYNGIEYKPGETKNMIPYNPDLDSISLNISFEYGRKNGIYKVPLKKGINKYNVYLTNLVDSIIYVGNRHPFDGVVIPEGMVGFKFFGFNNTISPDGLPINLVFYEAESEVLPGVEIKYKEIARFENINNNIPENFVFFKKPKFGKYIRVKALNNKKEDLIYNGKPVYTYLDIATLKDLSICRFETMSLVVRNNKDRNSNLIHSDGGVTYGRLYSEYMSR